MYDDDGEDDDYDDYDDYDNEDDTDDDTDDSDYGYEDDNAGEYDSENEYLSSVTESNTIIPSGYSDYYYGDYDYY